ncbi:MAG: hypothetical protein GX495_12755 [Chloroflexi bacterium]|nr:hypothetical protein [Chloroflexota bacterium]
MKSMLAEVFLVAGELCFLAGAAALLWGLLQPVETHSTAALGLTLIASGGGAKKRWNNRYCLTAGRAHGRR